MYKLFKKITTGLLLGATLFFILPGNLGTAKAAPASNVEAHTTLGDSTYINQDWMNYRFYVSGYGIECSLGIGEMKDYPVYIHNVRGITICELQKDTLINAFMANINHALSAAATPVNSVVYKNGETSISMDGESYYQLNDNARNWILGTLQQALMEKPEEIRLTLKEDYVTTAYRATTLSLSPDFQLSGSCTTSFKSSGSNRSTNITVASSHLNNRIVMPGECVSVSDALLPRTTANGYKAAHAYLNGKIVDQIGGGICQVSSTVYNAAMGSGMAVLERHPHSMPVSYLPLGMDAAISSGTKDLIFQNPYSQPVVIQTSIADKKLTVNFMVPASVLNGTTYNFHSKKLGSLSAESFLTTYVNGVETSTVSAGVSRYRALPADDET